MTIEELKEEYETISCSIDEDERVLISMGLWNTHGRTPEEYQQFYRMKAKYEIGLEIKKKKKADLMKLIIEDPIL